MSVSRHLRDLLELFAMPSLSVILPWRLCFGLYKRLARLEWLYREETTASLTGAERMGVAIRPVEWAWRYRLMRLVDHADLFLSLSRGEAWMRRHVHVVSAGWPASAGPFLAITFHWGNGLLGLWHLNSQGRQVAVLVRDIPQGAFKGRPILGLYARLRAWRTGKIGGADTVPSSTNSLRELKRRFSSGQNLVALLDVPTEGKKNVSHASFLGRDGIFPRGLIYFAVQNRIPIVAYTTGLDLMTGARRLDVSEPVVSDDENAVIRFLVDKLEQAVLGQPAYWHQWGGVEAFFAPAAPAGSTVSELK